MRLFNLLLVVIACSCSVRNDGAGQPSAADGKSLEQWLVAYGNATAGSQEEKVAETALQKIGTNAIPTLLRLIADPTKGEYLKAPLGFKALREMGAGAIPELNKILLSSNELSQTLAADSLAYIGAPAVPVLAGALTNRNFKIGTAAALAISGLGTNATPAVPVLLSQLQHTNHFYRERAADTLDNLHIEPDLIIPALTKLLNDPSKAAQFLALQGLGDFGRKARSAVPAIEMMLESENADIRKAAKDALEKIR